MGDQYSRRAVCAAAAAAILGGCVEGSGEDPTDNTTENPAEEEMDSSDSSTDEDTPVPPEERQQLVDQLPETSPLVGSLVDIVGAPDREDAAEEHGYDFRAEDHSVRVTIRLESGAELPSEYRVDALNEYQGYVTAYVHVDDLVPLAMDDAVRKVQRPEESRTHGGGQTDQRL